ncbi:hypothetical protein L1987_54197 [Smallanthus sonchifolius]|uniref:Uncharacterized protein n=1 Tax=Smallanthus sonchifolius TaxID=185202 RepID=A0ACB9E667_9ASTR|nr:hypothetical protein L1987_54197 [Smallanthus sonchifolius]
MSHHGSDTMNPQGLGFLKSVHKRQNLMAGHAALLCFSDGLKSDLGLETAICCFSTAWNLLMLPYFVYVEIASCHPTIKDIDEEPMWERASNRVLLLKIAIHGTSGLDYFHNYDDNRGALDTLHSSLPDLDIDGFYIKDTAPLKPRKF